MSDLIGICTRILDDAGYDLIPADGVKRGKVKDLWIAQNLRNAEHGQGLAPVAPKRRVVHVQHLDGTTETDLDWLARQYELDDYYQTIEAASYRCQ